MPRAWTHIGITVLVSTAFWFGCDRGTPDDRAGPPPQAHKPVQLVEDKPEYRFAPGLEESHPEVVAFMRRFMETCLAGDYGEYRRMVSRLADPESRGKFEKILNSLKSLEIDSIEDRRIPELDGPVYLVIGDVDLLPKRQVQLRRGDIDKVGILVFEEEGELRMMIAPAELQPGNAPATASAPATAPVQGPDYPWQQDGDY